MAQAVGPSKALGRALLRKNQRFFKTYQGVEVSFPFFFNVQCILQIKSVFGGTFSRVSSQVSQVLQLALQKSPQASDDLKQVPTAEAGVAVD